MTGDEVERAIEILLNNQANFDVRLAKTNEQLAKTDEQVEKIGQQIEKTNRQVEQTSQRVEEMSVRLDAYAKTQREFIQVVTRHIEAQGEINASLRASLARTDSRLDALIDIVREGRNGKSRVCGTLKEES